MRGPQVAVRPTPEVAGVASALSRLDAWLETMRAPHGYTGPVAHWWESNLRFTGALFDWRYEGLIDGYRELFLRSGDGVFLDRALQAADDVVAAQLPDGRFRNSSFQFGPVRGGTPHEAAIDVALLALVGTLRETGLGRGDAYLRAAERNLDGYWGAVLWNGRGFQDQPYAPVRVANKHGTALEAWLQLAALTGRDVDEYVLACVDAVRAAVVDEGPQAGGTVHLGIGPSRLAIPIYTARAMNGLLAYRRARGDRSVEPTLAAAAAFVTRNLVDEGVAWGIYGDGRPCPNPRMVAGAGDVLRFLVGMRQLDGSGGQAIARLAESLLAQQRPSGALPTARGFGRKARGGPPGPLELRDELPVVGWVDKAFRALALLLPPGTVVAPSEPAEHVAEVRWRGRRLAYRESADAIELRGARSELVYAWRKGAPAPDVCAL